MSDLKTKDYDWVNAGPELDEGSSEWLVENYPTIQSIIDASLGDLKKGPGIGPAFAAAIKRFANEIDKSKREEEALPKGSIIEDKLLDHVPTKRELEKLAEQEEELPPGKEYVLLEIPVDKSFTKRTRILVGEATCRECGFDVIMVNNLPPWDELSSTDRSRIRATLKEHHKKYHSNPSTKRVITEREMKETSWEHPEVLK